MDPVQRLNLEEVENVLAKLSEHSEGVHWLSNADLTKIQYISPAYEKIWGRPRELLYANPELWITYLHPEEAKLRHPIREMAERVQKIGPDARFEEIYRIVRPDDEIRWILDRGFPVCNEEGDCCGVIGIALDITQQKLAQDALYNSQNNPEATTLTPESKNKFIYNIRKISSMLLTYREIECLGLWLNGYSIKESAYCLGLSQKTVEAYRKNIKDKMGVYHKSQLIDVMQAKGAFNLCLSLGSFLKHQPKYNFGNEIESGV